MLDANDQERLQQLLRRYYSDYYLRQLGLPDYEQRVQRRLREENRYAAFTKRTGRHSPKRLDLARVARREDGWA